MRGARPLARSRPPSVPNCLIDIRNRNQCIRGGLAYLLSIAAWADAYKQQIGDPPVFNFKFTFAQDKDSSAVHGMPGEAIRLGAAALVLPPERIAAVLIDLANNRQSGVLG